MNPTGFGNYHQTEALPGALPASQNSPQRCSHHLFAEQLSGSAFTRDRHDNWHSWLYRRKPSVAHGDYQLYERDIPRIIADHQAPNPYRWSPHAQPEQTVDFIDGRFHVAGNSHLNTLIYQCNTRMGKRYFANNDSEMLLVPYQGALDLFTEFGRLTIQPGHIAVIPRGVVFQADPVSDLACGYLCENSGQPLTLPSLGLMGANALANPRHFIYPLAEAQDAQGPVQLLCHYQGRLWSCHKAETPLNVLAWHGNYAPYCYDLSLFNTINTVSFDHPDPSIFTVLSSNSTIKGEANLDFVIFPPRWMVAQNTFRPPYFHRNIMSELMGLIHGQYDAKKDGFTPGGISIHNRMVAHGPDTVSYEAGIHETPQSTRYETSLAFMFESNQVWQISDAAMQHASRQRDYSACWQGMA